MKKILLSLMLFVANFLCYSFAYQNQGFVNYIENSSDSIDFSCRQQCAIVLGEKGAKNTVFVEGIKGQGQLIIGALGQNQQFVPISQKTTSINDDSYTLPVTSSQIGNIPPQTQIALIVVGEITGHNAYILFDKASLSESIAIGWKEFWTFDSYRGYTINLLYGPKRNGISANKIFFWILIVSGLLSLFLSTTKRRKTVFLLIGSIWLLGDLRMGLETMNYYIDDYNHYISKEITGKLYRDRGDFYAFISFAQEELKKRDFPQNAKVNFHTDNTWPFPGSMIYFLYPHHVIINGTGNDYIANLYYGSSNAVADTNSKEKIQFNSHAFIVF